MSYIADAPDAAITGALARKMDRPLPAGVLGAGFPGSAFAELGAAQPTQARVAAVAEQRDGVRTAFAVRHGIDTERCGAALTGRNCRAVRGRPILAMIAVDNIEAYGLRAERAAVIDTLLDGCRPPRVSRAVTPGCSTPSSTRFRVAART
jgi:hypothetical protein